MCCLESSNWARHDKLLGETCDFVDKTHVSLVECLTIESSLWCSLGYVDFYGYQKLVTTYTCREYVLCISK